MGLIVGDRYLKECGKLEVFNKTQSQHDLAI